MENKEIEILKEVLKLEEEINKHSNLIKKIKKRIKDLEEKYNQEKGDDK